MPRSLRLIIPNCFYHVMNRGLDHRSIVYDEKDYRIFLRTLAELTTIYRVEIFAHCLMTNHYHLLVRPTADNLSRAMRHFGHAYTQRLNVRNGKDGPVFRGRFKSLLINEEDYLLQVLRYIHLNPVTAGVVTKAEDYPYSSHPIYLKGSDEGFLNCTELLNRFSSSVDEQISVYEKFINQGNQIALQKFYEKQKLGPILGTTEIFRSWETNLNKRNQIEEDRVDLQPGSKTA